MGKILGIIGGMGPLASAEFVKTFYELNCEDVEQGMPPCVLYSDPTFPDRTEAILSGTHSTVISRLVEVLQNFRQLGISKTVLCCITLHYFLPKVTRQLRENIISLLDLIIEEVSNTKKRHLLLCTTGTRRADIFQTHAQWSLAEPYVVMPDEEDQDKIHNYIYKIKQNVIEDSLVSYLKALRRKYLVDAFIAGCTEFHIVTKYLMKHKNEEQDFDINDPLLTLAKNYESYI